MFVAPFGSKVKQTYLFFFIKKGEVYRDSHHVDGGLHFSEKEHG